MSTFCPQSLSIAVAAAAVPPLAYYKLDVIGPGNVAIDSSPSGLDTNFNFPIVTIVAGKITFAHMWGAAGVRDRNAGLGLAGFSWTVRAWVKLNALPGFFYNYVVTMAANTALRLAAKGTGGTLPIPGSDSEGRPYFYSDKLAIPLWSDQGNINSALADLAWHRVVVRFDLATLTAGITLDAGTEYTAVCSAQPTTGDFRMSGPDSGGAPADDMSSCEIGLWKYRWTDAEMTTDWNGGAGKTYP